MYKICFLEGYCQHLHMSKADGFAFAVGTLSPKEQNNRQWKA